MYAWSGNSQVDILPRLRAGRPMNWCLIVSKGNRFSLLRWVHNNSGAHSSLLCNGYWRYSGRVWRWPLTAIYCSGEKCLELCLPTLTHLHYWSQHRKTCTLTIFQVVPFLRVYWTKLFFSHACYMPRQSHSSKSIFCLARRIICEPRYPIRSYSKPGI
jgi:hypothetical protein